MKLVTDLSHDGEDAFHEIQLSGKQLVFLFMATTVVSVVIFLCGVLVGRGVKAEALGASTVAAAGAPPASTLPPASTAGPVVQSSPSPAVEPPAAPVETQPALSYHKRLQSDKAPAEELKQAAADSKKSPEPVREVVPPPPASTSTPTPATAAAAPVAAAGTPVARAGTWAVQVVALTDRAAANAVVQRLAAKGYPAFLVNPQPSAPVQNYKVQVGRYSDRAEAEQVKGRLKKEEQFEPWILR